MRKMTPKKKRRSQCKKRKIPMMVSPCVLCATKCFSVITRRSLNILISCLDGEMVRTTIRQKDQRTSPQIHQKKQYASLLSALVHLCSSSVQSTQVKSTPPAKRKQRTLMTTKQECFSAKTNHWNRQSLLQSWLNLIQSILDDSRLTVVRSDSSLCLLFSRVFIWCSLFEYRKLIVLGSSNGRSWKSQLDPRTSFRKTCMHHREEKIINQTVIYKRPIDGCSLSFCVGVWSTGRHDICLRINTTFFSSDPCPSYFAQYLFIIHQPAYSNASTMPWAMDRDASSLPRGSDAPSPIPSISVVIERIVGNAEVQVHSRQCHRSLSIVILQSAACLLWNGL